MQMYNVLVVEDDIKQAHMIANYISEKFYNIKVYSMVTTGKEAIEILNRKCIDIILLDLLLPDISGIEILKYISDKLYNYYFQSVIVTTGEMDLLAQVVRNDTVFDYISKTSGIDRITNSIKRLLEAKGKEENIATIKEQINNELKKLSYNFSYNGTKYLADCIYEVFILKEKYNINLKKEIYPIIARRYNQNVNNIKTNISRATINMYYDCNDKMLNNYFGYDVIEKPKIKEIITRVIEKI